METLVVIQQRVTTEIQRTEKILYRHEFRKKKEEFYVLIYQNEN